MANKLFFQLTIICFLIYNSGLFKSSKIIENTAQNAHDALLRLQENASFQQTLIRNL